MGQAGGDGERQDGGTAAGRSWWSGLLTAHPESGAGGDGAPGSVSSNLKKSSMKTSLLKNK